jgi:hypothetical protein
MDLANISRLLPSSILSSEGFSARSRKRRTSIWPGAGNEMDLRVGQAPKDRTKASRSPPRIPMYGREITFWLDERYAW